MSTQEGDRSSHVRSPSPGQVVIVVYRAHPGKEKALVDLLKEHLPVLRGQGLATDRPQIVMRAKDGAFIEIFEWKSAAAIEEAHRNPVVQGLWKRFSAVSEFDSLSNVEETKQPFSAFEPVDLGPAQP